MNLYSRTLCLAAVIAVSTWVVLADESKKPTGTETSTTEPDRAAQTAPHDDQPYVPKTKQQLRKMLTPLQYGVTQNEETERAFRNLYWNNKKKGIYKCIVCDRELFSSATKYRSGTGWPSFYAPIDAKNLGYRKDWRLIYVRTEVHCARCNAHLGHVFDDGPQPTGKRYCMNSASLRFVETPPDSGGTDSGGTAAESDSVK